MANRLAQETSPYLRQHRDNPVDWYAWGEEAFAKARAEDKPILLSIGYSACHWCHVMAHESFEDDETAALVNELFVNVKVDREERPDVDAVYMEFVVATTGQGGWPMTVFLTPEGAPFYGGTYFPKDGRQGMPSFTQLCQAVDQHWKEHPDDIAEQTERVVEEISRSARIEPDPELPDAEVVALAVEHLLKTHDGSWGGFGRAPKFPQTMSLDLLLQVHARTGDPALLEVVTTSLQAMARGGIYDHLGGGFSRYSVDAFWMVPHFEKMLYDQALLARTYLHAWQVTGDPEHLQVLEEVVGYVQRDLATAEGGVTSAEDADSEGEEGRFYVWKQAQLREVLGDDADAAIDWWGVTPGGNFEGSTILHRPQGGPLLRPAEVEGARARLFEAREQRVRPGLDDKVLTEWNALWLATLAEAAFATGRTDWLDDAERLGEFLLRALRPDGRWLRSWQVDGGARHLAFASDHAALVDAFTRLAEATGDARWLREAVGTAEAMLELFWDDEHGGLFTTGHDAEALVARQKDFQDNAVPSANSQAAVALLRLTSLTGDARWLDRAEAILRLFGRYAKSHPMGFALLLQAVERHQAGSAEVVVAGDRPDLVDELRARYLPGVVLAWGERWDSPLWADRVDGRAYVCKDFTCQLPAEDPAALGAQLDAIG
jgi:uncharacterized protein YyaL (SSP411 family)